MSLEPWGIYAVSGLKATKKEKEKKKKNKTKKKRKEEKIESCFTESRVVGKIAPRTKSKENSIIFR